MMQHWKPFSLTHVTYPLLNPPSPSDRYLPPFLALLSLTPPFGVCALVTATVYQDVVAAHLLVGSLLSTALSAVLKRWVREPRPPRYDDDAEETEYGMPSNHACFAWFCAAFIGLYAVRPGGAAWAAASLPSRSRRASSAVTSSSDKLERRRAAASRWHHLHTAVAIGLVPFVAVGCSYSRIYLGYHTSAQVQAGALLGATLGALWYRLFETEAVRRVLVALDTTLNDLEQARREGMTMRYVEELDNNETKKD